MWFSTRQTYVEARSARSVHEALVYPMQKAKLGTLLGVKQVDNSVPERARLCVAAR